MSTYENPDHKSYDMYVVYRFLDSDGAAIYIGCSRQMRVRMYAGHTYRPWMAEAAAIEWTAPMSYLAAHDLEKAEIGRLRPRHNKQHNPDYRRQETAA